MIRTEQELIAMLKGAFCDFAIIDINAAGNDGRGGAIITLPAVQISDMWVIHPCIGEDDDRWTCTHLPTGFAARAYPSLAQALMGMGVLMTCDIPWELITNENDLKRIFTDLPEARRAVGQALRTIANLDIPVGSI